VGCLLRGLNEASYALLEPPHMATSCAHRSDCRYRPEADIPDASPAPARENVFMRRLYRARGFGIDL